MSKGISGLFKGTKGFLVSLAEAFYDRIMLNGDKNVDFKSLPGKKGITLPHRLSDKQMEFLTKEYGVEFAQVYILGKGKNGRGGEYIIFSGTASGVEFSAQENMILINHTHPGGTAYPSARDKITMELLAGLGSPQRTSAIIPLVKSPIKYTREGVKK